MELLKQELYKIFSKKYLFLILALMLLFTYGFDLVTVVRGSTDNTYNYTKPFEGTVSKEKENKIYKLFRSNEKKDKDSQITRIYKNMWYSYLAQTRPRFVAIADVLKEANPLFKNKELGERQHDFKGYKLNELNKDLKELKKAGKENTYEYKNKNKANNMYKKLSEPKFFYKEAWEYIDGFIIDFNLSIVVIMLLLGVSPVFSEEYKTKVATIILSSKKGRRECVRAKILASIIYSIFVAFICNFISTILITKIYGIEGFNSPMQSLYDFSCSPYNFTISQFLVKLFFTSLIGSILFVLLILIISNITKSSMMTFFISSFIFAFPMILQKVVGMSNVWWKKPLISLSVTQIINAREIYKVFSTINIFGQPLIYPYFILIYSIFLGTILVYILHRRLNYEEIK
ncbi:ABC transporter permease [Clostridium botulinum]|uniref:ABC transporter permease n=1 Tax=Clostridium botulinum TaxID=1491 RepID=UPI001A916B02|nr:ABC transporter permease [Clostridium botulinum]MBO0524587.1 ABC transporter permease [Clostridium botulinum]MBO0528130.1 ABC transporter permease [Clostridium botulinum]MBO0532180.1 ABC transporter permease [Clostridium botulinum]MBO0534572.1 ABC transporter permease [Clostridium botulinum]MBO0539310.1 ABC transporter permease [Clostridium botulinum]